MSVCWASRDQCIYKALQSCRGQQIQLKSLYRFISTSDDFYVVSLFDNVFWYIVYPKTNLFEGIRMDCLFTWSCLSLRQRGLWNVFQHRWRPWLQGLSRLWTFCGFSLCALVVLSGPIRRSVPRASAIPSSSSTATLLPKLPGCQSPPDLSVDPPLYTHPSLHPPQPTSTYPTMSALQALMNSFCFTF